MGKFYNKYPKKVVVIKMNENKTNINWYPGHMAKTKREIIENLKLIDVVIEILDARISISSQNPDIADIIKNKKKIILLNKYDLADDLQNKKWIQYFENKKIPALLINANDGKGIDKVISKIEEVMKDDLEKDREKGRVGRVIRVLVIRNTKCTVNHLLLIEFQKRIL